MKTPDHKKYIKMGERTKERALLDQQRINEALHKVDGLYESLSGWFSVSSDRELPLSHDDIVKIMADDFNIREAIKAYLDINGEGYYKDAEAASSYRDKLSWSLVDELDKRLKEIKDRG